MKIAFVLCIAIMACCLIVGSMAEAEVVQFEDPIENNVTFQGDRLRGSSEPQSSDSDDVTEEY
ncbi:hypothetical protein Bhyg_01675 [Pseudolycoriella hygida]|uniref:Secreted protein n=1 Tax=Pseudolycoriella hygida TaxID=35572 RepID=A0A9Q0S607_9DIPT|nr:hypothetical protein Bhyg_01675 [Pseudolycoriella hygida]